MRQCEIRTEDTLEPEVVFQNFNQGLLEKSACGMHWL